MWITWILHEFCNLLCSLTHLWTKIARSLTASQQTDIIFEARCLAVQKGPRVPSALRHILQPSVWKIHSSVWQQNHVSCVVFISMDGVSGLSTVYVPWCLKVQKWSNFDQFCEVFTYSEFMIFGYSTVFENHRKSLI